MRPQRKFQFGQIGVMASLPSIAGTIPEESGDDNENENADGLFEEVKGGNIFTSNIFQRGPIRTEFSSRDKEEEKKIEVVMLAAAGKF